MDGGLARPLPKTESVRTRRRVSKAARHTAQAPYRPVRPLRLQATGAATPQALQADGPAQDELRGERGTPFITGAAFYRAESAQGRDLAVLVASLHRQRTGSLRVLDVMAGSGVRGARYIEQAGAQEVWCNDYNPSTHRQLVYNLCNTAQRVCSTQPDTQEATTTDTAPGTNHLPHSIIDPTNQQKTTNPTANPSHSSLLHAATAATDTNPTCQSVPSSHTCESASHTFERQIVEAVDRWDQLASVSVPPGLRRQVWEWHVGVEGPASLICGPHHSTDSHSPAALAAAMGHVRQAGGEVHGTAMSSDASMSSHSHTAPATQTDATHSQPSPSVAGIQGSSHVTAATGQVAGQPGSPPLHAQTSGADSTDTQGQQGVGTDAAGHGPVSVKVSHMDAKRLLASLYLSETFYDLIDVDSFGSENAFLGSVLDAVSYKGGLLYLTSTDGFSSSGRRPVRSLAAYGCYSRPLPYANEQGLRMLIGAAVKEAAVRGVWLTPVFSLFSYHGPVFRVMLRAKRSGLWPSEHYGFVGYCRVCGMSRAVEWTELGHATCRCCQGTNTKGSAAGPSLTLAGPMWTGALHSQSDIQDMISEAQRLGWSGHSPDAGPEVFGSAARTKKNGPRPLEDMLQVLLEESDERLPPGYILIETLGKYLTSYPPRDKFLSALRSAGFAAARCHLDAKAFRTNASIEQCVRVACDMVQHCV